MRRPAAGRRVRELDQELGLTLERAAPIRVWLDLGPRRGAAWLGVSRLYLYTQTARGLYERLGWEQIGELTTQGRPADLMSKRLRPGPDPCC